MIYHFNLHDGPGVSGSDEVELRDLEEARIEAVRFAASILIDAPEEFWASEEWSLDVTDQAGLILFSICLSSNEAPAIMGSFDPTNRLPL